MHVHTHRMRLKYYYTCRVGTASRTEYTVDRKNVTFHGLEYSGTIPRRPRRYQFKFARRKRIDSKT